MSGKNSKTITSKERMLKKIRHALLVKKENPFPNFEETPLWKPSSQDKEIVFAEQFLANGGQFIYCEDEIHLVENLLLLTDQKSLRKIYVWDEKLKSFLDSFEFPYFKTDSGFEDAEVSIIGCEALIARTGSVLVSNGENASRRISIYPPIQVIIAHSKQIVWDIEEALHKMKLKYPHQEASQMTFISGPSRTADIEKNIVLGVHGPKEVYILLVE